MTSLLYLAGRLWPFERGRMRFFLMIYRRIPLRDLVSKISNTVKLRNGLTLFSYTNEFTSLWFKLYGCYEPQSVSALAKELQGGGLFLDIGANLGIFSLFLAESTPCETIAFEPNPGTAALLRKSVDHNGLGKRITILERAVSDTNGVVSFYNNETNSGDSGLATESTEKTGQSFDVRVIALDSDPEFQKLLAEAPKLKAVKMDIQGAEVHALQGMKNLLAAHSPALLIEIASDCLERFGKTEDDLLKLLNEYGYREVLRCNGNSLFKKPDS